VRAHRATFVGTAVSSDPAFTAGRTAPSRSENPHVRYSDRNGYTRAIVDRDRWRSEFVAADAKHADGQVHLAAAHVVEDGRPGAHGA
jgi:hypothetical protein